MKEYEEIRGKNGVLLDSMFNFLSCRLGATVAGLQRETRLVVSFLGSSHQNKGNVFSGKVKK